MSLTLVVHFHFCWQCCSKASNKYVCEWLYRYCIVISKKRERRNRSISDMTPAIGKALNYIIVCFCGVFRWVWLKDCFQGCLMTSWVQLVCWLIEHYLHCFTNHVKQRMHQTDMTSRFMSRSWDKQRDLDNDWGSFIFALQSWQINHFKLLLWITSEA